ncbi:MAG: HAMP domain-containing histidine kinase [Bacteroidales bacterium]|nr:HAMP domain-containing histidine kinase [Bacteroidales bacterium]
MNTHYASAERASKEQIMFDFSLFESDADFKKFLDSIPFYISLLNEQRQIVFSNIKMLDLLNADSLEAIIGNRPGEVVLCVNCDLKDKGCGTSKYCKYCGAVNSIIKAQNTKRMASEECRINVRDGESFKALDLKTTTTPFDFKGKTFYIFSIEDISTQKRKHVLERVFYHDALNTATSINGLARMVKKYSTNEEFQKYVGILNSLTQNLTEEILMQSNLSVAESGELVMKYSFVSSKAIILNCINAIKGYELATDIDIVLTPDAQDITIYTDEVLLRRVLLNMMKNAVEASLPSETVTIGCEKTENKVRFWVHNSSVISQDIQEQLFQRSFSTKGSNRGIGTYSMKLLGEKYLKGTVSFTSDQERGTEFYIILPEQIETAE